jgi:hypothetical protein
MRYFWLLDGKTQGYFKYYYQSGLKNFGDYPSKHHTADIYQHVRPYYVHMNNSLTLLPRAMKLSTCQGCAKILGIPTTRNLHYQALATSPFWPTPLSYPVTEYLASQEYNRVYHSVQPSKNRSTIEAHNSRECLLAVPLVEVS